MGGELGHLLEPSPVGLLVFRMVSLEYVVLLSEVAAGSAQYWRSLLNGMSVLRSPGGFTWRTQGVPVDR